MRKQFWVYLVTNQANAVLYIGVTNDLSRRLLEHHGKQQPGFTARYGVEKLVYFEELGDSISAIQREKQLKGWSRAKKVALITTLNPYWNDLAEGE
jgi:putative endonuclease